MCALQHSAAVRLCWAGLGWGVLKGGRIIRNGEGGGVTLKEVGIVIGMWGCLCAFVVVVFPVAADVCGDDGFVVSVTPSVPVCQLPALRTPATIALLGPRTRQECRVPVAALAAAATLRAPLVQAAVGAAWKAPLTRACARVSARRSLAATVAWGGRRRCPACVPPARTTRYSSKARVSGIVNDYWTWVKLFDYFT